MVVSVKLKPGARRNIIDRCDEQGVLHVAVHARAVDNAANEALIELFSNALHISKSAVIITKGFKSKNKIVSIEGVESIPEEIYGKYFR